MQAHADRYMYLPLIGLTLALAFLGRGRRARATRAARAARGRGGAGARGARARGDAAGRLLPRSDRAAHPHRGRDAEQLRRAPAPGECAAARGTARRSRARVRQRARARSRAARDLRLGLGDVLARSGRVDEAIAQYRLAIAADPRAARAHANLGLALASSGQLDEAKLELERALALTAPGPQGADGRARVLSAVLDLAADGAPPATQTRPPACARSRPSSSAEPRGRMKLLASPLHAEPAAAARPGSAPGRTRSRRRRPRVHRRRHRAHLEGIRRRSCAR